MPKYHHLLATVSVLLLIASFYMGIQNKLLIGAILAPLASASMIGAVFAQRIYIKRVLGRKNSHE
ncbi:hypothetical protein [Paenibacillus polysaccharolyticus]|uniref:hypothetical protein n=1 Tax=Paenibacillus polysaccharolyticus TaxID=582692 RepID=UPI00300A8FC7